MRGATADNSQVSIAQLNALLAKTSDWDKDERYMATNDLCNALQKDPKIDENMEQRICAAVLKQLDDQSNDVQSVAVKCLAIIIKKVQRTQIGSICTKLCSLILEGKDALRDVYSIGLKTLIVDVPDSRGALVADTLTVRLLTGINSASEDIQRECLDNMADLLRRFGQLNVDHHSDIMTVVVSKLRSEKPVLRKRATHCLGSLAVVSSDALLNQLMQSLLQSIEVAEEEGVSGSTLIQTIGTISRTVGFRLGRHLERIVPLFIRCCGDPEDESQQTDAVNELRENCFPGLESFVLRCPREVAVYLSDILAVSLKFLKYDPNYNYDDDDDEVSSGEGDSMDVDEGEEEDAEYDEADGDYDEEDDEDDDTSWKVRKAAVKVVAAVIQTRPDMLQELYGSCGEELVRRFKEREENVRLDIIKAFTLFMSSAAANSTGSSTGNARHHRAKIALPQLEEKLPKIIGICCKQLQGNSVKTKSAVFALLQTLTSALEGRGMDPYVPRLMQQVEKCLTDKSQSLKLDALVYLRIALQSHQPAALQPSLGRLLELVVSAGREDWYKIIAETLRVLAAALSVLRPRDVVTGAFTDSAFAFPPLLRKIYDAVMPRLEALDMDQEIKECAIFAAGQILSIGGDELTAEVPAVLAIFSRRLENETTRLPTLRALIAVASSPLEIDLSEFLSATAKELALFLRQSSRVLKQLSLQALRTIVVAPRVSLTGAVAGAVLEEAAALITESDLHMSQLSLSLSLALLQKDPSASSAAFQANIYPRLLLVAKSSLLQGQALVMLMKTFSALAAADLPQMTSAGTFDLLYNVQASAANYSSSRSTVASPSRGTQSAELSKAALSNLSKCVGALFAAAPAASIDAAVARFLDDLRAADSSESSKQLALLCLGEVGHSKDLSAVPELQQQVLKCFQSSSEDTRLSAAYALGHVAVGNMSVFLPIVLQSAESDRQQYLLLAALKEIVIAHANLGLDFRAHLPHVLPPLVQQCQAQEESVRNMVAECLGVLTAMISDQTIPVLLQLLQRDESDKLARRMIANVVRFSLSRNASEASIAAVKEVMGQFLPLLDDSDLEVKRAALLMVNTAVHHYPHTLAARLHDKVVPVLVETLKIKLERSVDLGPFKHKVDDNLPLRKISLTCMETILDSSAEQVDLSVFMQVMPLLLADKDDIKMQAHQILVKLCSFSPGVVVGQVDQLIAPLAKTAKKKPAPKDDIAAGTASAVGSSAPQADRSLDLVKSALRAAVAINSIEDIAQISRNWNEFFEGVKRDEFTRSVLQSVEKEKAFDSI